MNEVRLKKVVAAGNAIEYWDLDKDIEGDSETGLRIIEPFNPKTPAIQRLERRDHYAANLILERASSALQTLAPAPENHFGQSNIKAVLSPLVVMMPIIQEKT